VESFFRRLVGGLRSNWIVWLGLLAVAALILAVDPSKLGRALANADGQAVLLMLPTVGFLYVLHGIAWSFALRGARVPVGVRQAVVVSFVSQFQLLGALFLVLLPFVLFMRRPRGGRGPAAAH